MVNQKSQEGVWDRRGLKWSGVPTEIQSFGMCPKLPGSGTDHISTNIGSFKGQLASEVELFTAVNDTCMNMRTILLNPSKVEEFKRTGTFLITDTLWITIDHKLSLQLGLNWQVKTERKMIMLLIVSVALLVQQHTVCLKIMAHKIVIFRLNTLL